MGRGKVGGRVGVSGRVSVGESGERGGRGGVAGE